MIKSMLAIDVAHRVPELLEMGVEIKLSSSDEARKSKSRAQALAVSIYQIVDEAILLNLPYLRHIFVLGTSVKNIDTAYCLAHDIQISVVRHYCDQETVEWVMLEIAKLFRDQKRPVSVMGKSLGIIGLGDVGMSLKNLAQAFFMDVLINTPKKPELKLKDGGRWASKVEIFSLCDVVSFHTPAYTPWLTRELFEIAKPGQVWINTCMGAITLDPHFADFLAKGRVKLIMDDIAGLSHQHLAHVATIDKHKAFDTIDSEARLKEKFLANIKSCL